MNQSRIKPDAQHKRKAVAIMEKGFLSFYRVPFTRPFRESSHECVNL
jgi:hypothetical protein